MFFRKRRFREDDLRVQGQLSELSGGAGGRLGQPGPPEAPLSERSVVASMDSRFDWQKGGPGSMSRGFSEATLEMALASARCIFRYIIASHQFEPFILNLHFTNEKIGSAEHAPAALAKLLSRNRVPATALRTFLYVIKRLYFCQSTKASFYL